MTTTQPDPPLAPDELVSTGGEREVLEAFLDLYRDVLKRKLGGLSDEQIRQRRVPSQTTLGGLIKHLTAVEREWFQVILAGRTEDALPGNGWTLGTGESIGDLIAGYERACAASRREASGFALEDSVPHPRMGRVSLRWIYVHMIEESARHVGHADILREQTDGATGFDGLRLPRDPRRHGMVVATYPLFWVRCHIHVVAAGVFGAATWLQGLARRRGWRLWSRPKNPVTDTAAREQPRYALPRLCEWGGAGDDRTARPGCGGR